MGQLHCKMLKLAWITHVSCKGQINAQGSECWLVRGACTLASCILSKLKATYTSQKAEGSFTIWTSPSSETPPSPQPFFKLMIKKYWNIYSFCWHRDFWHRAHFFQGVVSVILWWWYHQWLAHFFVHWHCYHWHQAHWLFWVSSGWSWRQQLLTSWSLFCSLTPQLLTVCYITKLRLSSLSS